MSLISGQTIVVPPRIACFSVPCFSSLLPRFLSYQSPWNSCSPFLENHASAPWFSCLQSMPRNSCSFLLQFLIPSLKFLLSSLLFMLSQVCSEEWASPFSFCLLEKIESLNLGSNRWDLISKYQGVWLRLTLSIDPPHTLAPLLKSLLVPFSSCVSLMLEKYT